MLGVAGTPFTQEGNYDSSKDSFEGQNYVAGPCQLFRRECFQEIGGYVPNRSRRRRLDRGDDSTDEGMDKFDLLLKSDFIIIVPWERRVGALCAHFFSYGEKDYYLGGSPLWELFRVTYRTTKKPVVL